MNSSAIERTSRYYNGIRHRAMLRMGTRKTNSYEWILGATGILSIIVGISLTTYYGLRLDEDIARQREMTRGMGEILRLDELLTMSARLSVSASDLTYRDRYNANVAPLNQEIQNLLTLARSEDVSAAIRSTDEANNRLIAIEEHAFALCAEGQCKEGSDLLQSSEYSGYKASYSQGMQRAFKLITTESKESINYLWSMLALAQLGSAANFLLIVFFYLRLRSRAARIAIDEERSRAFRNTVDFIMDYFNNMLHKSVLFLDRLDDSKALSQPELQHWRQIIEDAAKHLVLLSSDSTITVKSSPLEHVRECKEPAPENSTSSINRSGQGTKILLVEDDKTSQAMLRKLLENQNYAVHVANNGAEGLQALECTLFDLVLMDIQMPVMDGVECLKHIRDSQKNWSTIPVVAVTGQAALGDKEKLLCFGFNGYVPKPIQKQILLDQVRTFIGGSESNAT